MTVTDVVLLVGGSYYVGKALHEFVDGFRKDKG